LSTSKKSFKLQINIRTAFGYDGKSVLKQIKSAAKEYKLSARIVQSMDATMIKRDSHFILILGDIYRGNTGDDKMFNVAYGASYAKAMPNIVSFGPIFPGDIDSCHEINERVSIKQLIKAGEIYYQSIFKLCL
jgi:succinyl-diaminopimelate desuccinylase